MPATPAWLAVAESVLNRGVGRSQKAEALARRLNGTALRVEVDGIARIRIAVCGDRLAIARSSMPRPRTMRTRRSAVRRLRS